MAKSKTMTFAVNDDVVNGVARIQRELGPVWQETLGAPMSRSEAIRWLVQAGLRSFESSMEAQEERAEIAFESRGRRRKVKRTITLDAAVDEALPALQKRLEEELYPYGGNEDLRALHGPVKYNASSVVQMAITKLMTEMGVDPWNGARVAADPATGKVSDMPDGEETRDNPEET